MFAAGVYRFPGSNYDYEDVHRDYLAAEVVNDVGMTYYAHIVEKNDGGYTARVRDLRTFQAVNKDVIRRWTYPLVPDSNFPLVEPRFASPAIESTRRMPASFLRERQPSVSITYAICKRTRVGERAIIRGSVIGRRCKIGRNVRIEDSILFGDVEIEDNATITKLLLCDYAFIGEGCVVPSGCVAELWCQWPAGQKLKKHIRLTSEPLQAESDDDMSDSDTDVNDDALPEIWMMRQRCPRPRKLDGSRPRSTTSARSRDTPDVVHEWTFQEFCMGNEAESPPTAKRAARRATTTSRQIRAESARM